MAKHGTRFEPNGGRGSTAFSGPANRSDAGVMLEGDDHCRIMAKHGACLRLLAQEGGGGVHCVCACLCWVGVAHTASAHFFVMGTGVSIVSGSKTKYFAVIVMAGRQGPNLASGGKKRMAHFAKGEYQPAGHPF